METLDKLIVQENYLTERIFNMDEISIYWKPMPERAFIHKQAKSMSGFRVCVSTGLFISPSGISELDCATTKTDTAERSISIGRESLQVFFLY